MKNVTFFFLFTFGLVYSALGQSTFVLVDSARVTNPSFSLSDTGYTGTGYRFSLISNVAANSPTVVPYVRYAASYASRPLPQKVLIKMRAPLWVGGISRVGISFDRGGVGDTASSSQLVYVFPSSNWTEYQFTMGPGSTQISRLIMSFSMVPGDSGTRVIFTDDVRVITGTDTTTIDDGGSSSSPIPGVPVLSFPASLATNVTVPVPFQWNASTGAKAYWLQVFTNTGTIFKDTTLSGTICSVSGLQAGTQYTWRVSSQNSTGNSDWSDTWLFTTALGTSGTPTPSQPANNATNQSTNPLISWSSVGASVTYRLQISTNSGFSTVTYERSGISSTSHVVQVSLSPGSTYYWRVRGEGSSVGPWSSVSNFLTTMVTVVSGSLAVPTELTLEQNYPNPFNPTTVIKFSVPEISTISLSIFDVTGREVDRLIENETFGAGFHTATFDGSKLSSGVYLYRLSAGRDVRVGRMILMK